ncbi:HAD family hydrolase [Paenibacillus eucommiae]|uniref:Hydroxymethylpyrimidine pyrophosphatase-like HAD family hydrolase n=1 Tax=Paenibacillus eucommiae TaxID=1355755 RepID=A0ABS4J0X9_9BACL|nr:HAD family hydrolase [Paenibacillus eucommiae]MBP1993487.1 hydroxymethylpyrimidine pyrophosphatase-like HAD family hydrolase [Paenibacillus eucommiae]
MIFASDLDQTLIYSQRSMGSSVNDELSITSAEAIDGEIKSYMSVQTFKNLQELMSKLLFVPVTTRTMAQYVRIHLFKQRLRPRFAITSNGGNILIDGVPDNEWNQSIRALVKATSSPAEDAARIMNQIMTPEWVVGSRYCDELFYSYVIQRDQMPMQAVLEVSEELKKMGWHVSIQGRKVYSVPMAVSKKDAIAHVKNLTKSRMVIASGDSLLDQSMLDYADYSIVPKHGELYRQEQKKAVSNYLFTEASGIFAADEILQFVDQILQEHTIHLS